MPASHGKGRDDKRVRVCDAARSSRERRDGERARILDDAVTGIVERPDDGRGTALVVKGDVGGLGHDARHHDRAGVGDLAGHVPGALTCDRA